jgi:hypothetical protein
MTPPGRPVAFTVSSHAMVKGGGNESQPGGGNERAISRTEKFVNIRLGKV